MFSFFKKDPLKKLEQQYRDTLEEAMLAQRNGDIRGYSALSSEAETLLLSIDRYKADKRETK